MSNPREIRKRSDREGRTDLFSLQGLGKTRSLQDRFDHCKTWPIQSDLHVSTVTNRLGGIDLPFIMPNGTVQIRFCFAWRSWERSEEPMIPWRWWWLWSWKIKEPNCALWWPRRGWDMKTWGKSSQMIWGPLSDVLYWILMFQTFRHHNPSHCLMQESHS